MDLFPPPQGSGVQPVSDLASLVEKESGHSLKLIHFGKGGEFLSHKFDHHLEAHGVCRELANTGTPSKNDVM